MKVLGIGYGRHLFDKNDFEYQRLSSCASKTTSYDHIVFTSNSDGFDVFRNDEKFTLHPTSSKSRIRMVFDAVSIGDKLIKEKGIEVVTAQDPFAAGLVGYWLKLLNPKVRLQVQEHGDVLGSRSWRRESPSNQFKYYFAMVILKKADIIRIVSKRTEDFIYKKFGQNKQVRRLPVVIDVHKFQEEYAGDRSGDGTFTFVTAARFVEQKNLPLMIEAFNECYKNNRSLRLKIFGAGKLQNHIEALVRNLDVSDAVVVSGWCKNLPQEMKSSDAYLLTSNYEGWARVLVEAMIVGIPTVTTDVGCAREVLLDKEHGLVVPVGDKEALVSAMETMSQNSSLYNEIKNNLSELDVDTLPGTNVQNYGDLWLKTLS